MLSLPQLLVSLLVAVAVLLLLDHRRRHPVLLPFLADLWHSPQAQWAALGLQDHLAYPTVVPTGPDGRPGERLMGPSESVRTGHIDRDGIRSDCYIQVGRGASVTVTCHGRRGHVDLLGLAHHLSSAWSRVVVSPVASTMAGEPAVTYTVARGTGRRTRWHFLRDGWLFTVCYSRSVHARPRCDRLAQETLGSWTWLDGPTRP